jgi:hypothetical protein
MRLQDKGTKRLNSAKSNSIPQQEKGPLAFPYQSAQHRGYPAIENPAAVHDQGLLEQPGAEREQIGTARYYRSG